MMLKTPCLNIDNARSENAKISVKNAEIPTLTAENINKLRDKTSEV